MTTEERRALLDRAITTYGAAAQMDMAVEEMAELTKALCKIKRAQAGCEVTAAIGNVIEEMADVQIMLDQLRIIFQIHRERGRGDGRRPDHARPAPIIFRSTAEAEEYKLERLKKRLDTRPQQGAHQHRGERRNHGHDGKRSKPQPQSGPEIEEYSTTATPKAYAGSVPVFCAHDAIVPLKDLRPNPKNPNQHPPEQIKLLASIIRATGWRAPITVSKRSGLVTKGHGRLMAAQLDDLTDAPVDYQDYASEAEELADLTADNRIAELATTDNKMLAEVFADIDTGEIPFMLSGYTEDDYGNIVTALSEALHTKEPSSDPDAEIPAPAAPVTQYGDLWILGRHRVLCGDCTRPEDRALLLDGNKPEILLTDPPYCSGGSKESQKSTGSIGTERKNGKAPKIANDILSTRGYQNLIRGALTDIPCLYAYIFTDWRMWVYLFDIVEAAGFGVKSEIVWDKGTPGMGVGWRSQHELILFGAKAATHFDGHKGYGNVLSISRSGNELHPTQKPVELLEKLVDNTDFATGVYDPFGGSGTTLAACEAYGQPSYIMELTPAFTDVIVKRYIRITGKTTVRCVRQGRELPREEIAAIFEPDEEGGEQE